MRDSTTGARLFVLTLLAGALLALGASERASAADGKWTLRLGLSYVDSGGQDPTVLITEDSSGARTHKLKTDSGAGPLVELRWAAGEKWSWGADFRSWVGTQALSIPAASAQTVGSPVTYRITERSFQSDGPSESVYFRRLGDTDTSVWTADLYARRRLSGDSSGGWHLLFGLRNADFDNDNRFAAGITDVEGSRIDASSNYSRMIGPIAGLVFDRESGKHHFEVMGSISVVTGDVELSSSLFDFTGPLEITSEEPPAQETFNRSKNVTIPIAELGVRWTYAANGWLGFGAGLGVSHWTDVSVPPGVRPTGTLDTLYEDSITYLGASAAIQISF